MWLALYFILLAIHASAAPTTQAEPRSIDAAIAAMKDPINPSDPRSIERAAKPLEELIIYRAADPDIYKAKLVLANVLSADHRQDGVARSAVIMREIIPLTNLTTQIGRDLTEKFIWFEINEEHPAFPEDQATATAMADKLEKWAESNNSRPLLLRTWAYEGSLKCDAKHPRDALTMSLKRLKQGEQWWADGYFRDLFNSDLPQYNSARADYWELVNTINKAIVQSEDDGWTKEQVKNANLDGAYPFTPDHVEHW